MPRTLFRYFWSFIRPYKFHYLSMVIIMLLWSLSDSLIPYMLKLVIDDISKESATFPLSPVFGFIGLFVISDIVGRAYEWIHLNVIPKTKGEMRDQMFRYTMQHSHRYFQDRLSGTLSNKIFDMVRGFDNLVSIFFMCLFPITLRALFSAVFLTMVNPLFGALFTTWFVLYIITLIFLGKKCIAYSDDQAKANSQLSGKVVDVFRNMSTVRMFARQPLERENFNKAQAEEVKKSKKLLKHMWITHIFQGTASVLLMSAMLLLLIFCWNRGMITIGDFTFVAQTSFSLVMFSWWMGSQFPLLFKEWGASKQALELLQEPHEIVDLAEATELKITSGHLHFSDVHFHYMPKTPLFKGLDVEIQGNRKVGLVGFSGSGKSTFVNLLQRFFELHSGHILLDGQDIRTVTQESLRRQIAVIPQDPVLFHRSLLDNLRYGLPEATESQVIATAKLAHCHEFIMDMPEKYHSMVGEGGVKLSGGQRQRIAIARAMLKNAPLLILDEATSALDSVTEKKIQESLSHLMEGKTTIVIAHRLSTLLHLDEILVFSDGQIIERGAHKELLAKQGHYANLWSHQQDGIIS